MSLADVPTSKSFMFNMTSPEGTVGESGAGVEGAGVVILGGASLSSELDSLESSSGVPYGGYEGTSSLDDSYWGENRSRDVESPES